MALSFKDLKKSRQDNLKKLTEQLNKMVGSKGTPAEESDIFWSPTIGPDGNGFAIVRFVPPKGEDMPWIQKFSHGFRGPSGAWYIENSLTTLGKPDPCGLYNSYLWNQGPAGQAQARNQKRRLTYYANVYVIKDSAKPENEGKVLVWRFGKKILEKIINQIKPPEAEGGLDAAIDPFDLWSGRNLKVRAKTVKVVDPDTGAERKYPNYDNSEWDSPGPLFKDDAKLEEVYNNTHSLTQFIAPSEFKEFEELEAILTRVMGMEETGLPSAKNNKGNKVSSGTKSAPRIPSKTTSSVAMEGSDDAPFDLDEGNDDLDKLFADLKAD